MTSKPKLFLLGGHDLEMEEIRKLLETHSVRYEDRHLEWGAKLSDYADLLDFDGTIYGIELLEDITPPARYRAIDHHGKDWCLPSSLEQVAEILGVELDRRQRLIAANDRGHVAGMIAQGATQEEIRQIRSADRRAQGVSPQEEEQAQQEAQRAERKGKVWIVETSLHHTSPLVDRLLEERKTPLIVVKRSDPSLSYYGDSVSRIVGAYRDAVEKGMAYYGGNPLGYFGLTSEWFADHEIDGEIEKIVSLHEESKIRSYHIFMLPFVVKKDEKPPKEGNDHWEHRKFTIDDPEEGELRYNEYTYFHPYVREVLFEKDDEKNPISRYYEYRHAEGIYRIEVGGKHYDLRLDGIALRWFDNGIEILSFHLINDRYDSFDDILRINEFGRRTFPQYLGKNLVDDTKNNLLACRLGIIFDDGREWIEDFSNYRSLPKIDKNPHRLPNFIDKLLQQAFGENHGAEPILDDRMYLLCHLMDARKSAQLSKETEQGYAYESNQEWYRFVFVDGDEAMCQSKRMLKDLIRKSTYDRWVGYGTLFGITRYSFVILSGEDWFARNVLDRHLRTVYYQMMTLPLAYRAMMLQFSKKVADVLEKKDKKVQSDKLFMDFLKFKNRIYFHELTAQEQGIELFDMTKKQMRLTDRLTELDQDIAELHDFLTMQIEEKRSEQGHLLNTLAAIFLPASLLAGMFGMNFIDFDQHNFWASSIAVGLIVIVAPLLGWLWILNLRSAKKLWSVVGAILIALIMVLVLALSVLFYPYPNGEKDKAGHYHKGQWGGLLLQSYKKDDDGKRQ